MRLFIKDNKGYIIIYMLSVIVTLTYIYTFKGINIIEILYILFFNIVILIIFLVLRYYKNIKLYNSLEKGINTMEDSLKSYGESPLGEAFSQNLKSQYEFYIAKIEKIKNNYNEHTSFITEWVHQMKTPIAVLKLKNEDMKNNICTNIDEEISKLDRGLTLSLYYARISDFKKDFVINKINLKTVVTCAINNEKQLFIRNNIFPKVNINEGVYILTDKKWFAFLLDQIIVNGIKYSKNKGKILEVSLKEEDTKYILSIRDEGIGIDSKNLKRVFDAFFTGENGRKYGESTGMGLYISEKICENLNHKISIKSKVNEGTEVFIFINK